MRRRVGFAVVALGAVWLGVASRSPSDAPRSTPAPTVLSASTSTASTTIPAGALAVALERVRQRAPDSCASVSLGDRVLYSYNAESAVQPASVTKVLTAVAALDVLGADARLRTAVRGPLDNDGTVQGDLVLVGGGDPVLSTDAWAEHRAENDGVRTSLDTLADRVVAAGVRRVTGGVRGDDSRYDQRRGVDSWPPRLVRDGEVGPLSALLANDGFRVAGHPGVAFDDPAEGAASLLRELLSRRGVSIGGAAAGKQTVVVELASIDSPPVGELVTEMLRESDNGTAELLVKELGLRRYGVGSTAAGVAVVAAAMAVRHAPLDGTVIVDGSGLSSSARVTCRLLVDVLVSARALLADRLPIAGQAGTLRQRLRGTVAAGRVRAKTGSLDGVSALAGYADTASGHRLAFAYVLNGLPIPTSSKAVQDPFAIALVESGP